MQSANIFLLEVSFSSFSANFIEALTISSLILLEKEIKKKNKEWQLPLYTHITL
jgi:hypothetical protein